MTATTLKLKGMSCASCANSIESAIQQVPGVNSVQVNFAAEQANVEYDERSTNLKAIQSAIANAGYEASERKELGIGKEDDQEQAERKAQQRDLRNKTLVSGIIGLVLIIGTLPMMLGTHIPGWPMFYTMHGYSSF